MAVDEGVFVVCLTLLRWLGLSFTRIRRSPKGHLVAVDSKFHLMANLAVAGGGLFAFARIDPTAFGHTADAYKSSTIVYPLYNKLMIFTVVAFSLCGNVYNRKFAGIVNLFLRVSRALERDFGHRGLGGNEAGRRILAAFGAYAAATTAFNLWTDTHITLHFGRVFRVIHYLSFYCVTIFTAHFVVTMTFVKEKYGRANEAFGRMVRAGGGPRAVREKLEAWMAASLELREAEALVNEVFGKQVCLTLLLAFSSVIVNVYYFITLNLYGTSTAWLNLNMIVATVQAVAVTLINTRAAEAAAEEANRINQIIFSFPVHLHGWQMLNKVKYFTFFSHYYPVEFKAWIFSSITYGSLLKVMLTSSAITAVILQCDFLRGSFHA